MRANLTSLFPSLQLLSDITDTFPPNVYIFEDPATSERIAIDKNELSIRELSLLSAVYNRIELDSTSKTDTLSKDWFAYLDGLRPLPLDEKTDIRAIQLSFPEKEIPKEELIEAVEAFFGDGLIVLFSDQQQTLLIDRKSEYIHTTEDFTSFAAVLESDFFLKTRLYIGKFHAADAAYPLKFQSERDLFMKGSARLPKERIFTMEKVFPSLLVDALPENMEQTIETEILIPIKHDSEMLHTVRSFFENGFNGSVTAEKLNIHRNTLNYRLKKFQDITGISVRSFEGALVAYYASLIAFK